MKNSKSLEYYLDSKKYDYESVQKSIDNTKKEYEKKEVEVNVKINKYGMYIITFYFRNKDTVFNRIRLYFRRRNNKKLLLQGQKNNDNKCKYGEYKSGTIYHPY